MIETDTKDALFVDGGQKQANQCLGSQKVHWSVSKLSKKKEKKKPFSVCSNKPVRKTLNNPIDCPSPLRNKGLNELYRCRPEKQQSSRWEKAVRQPAESILLKLCSFTMGHLYLEQLSSSRGVLVLPALVSQSLICKSLAEALLIKSSL